MNHPLDYPAGFPAPLRPAVEQALARAQILFYETAGELAPSDGATKRCRTDQRALQFVVEVFSAFARQACAAARKDLWRSDRVRTGADEFLLLLTRYAYHSLPGVNRWYRGSAPWSQEEFHTFVVAEVMTSTVWIDHLREREEVFAAKSAGQGNAPAGAAEGRSAGSSPEKSDAPVQADGIVSLERKRADWLMTLMAADPKLTPYRIYQCGGPAKETLKLILDGKRVEPTTIKKLVSALQRAEVWTGERPISMEDIPK